MGHSADLYCRSVRYFARAPIRLRSSGCVSWQGNRDSVPLILRVLCICICVCVCLSVRVCKSLVRCLLAAGCSATSSTAPCPCARLALQRHRSCVYIVFGRRRRRCYCRRRHDRFPLLFAHSDNTHKCMCGVCGMDVSRFNMLPVVQSSLFSS